MADEFSPDVAVENSPLRCGSVASISAWRFDVGEGVEIEVDDGLQGFGGGGVVQAFGQGVGPGGVVGLQREQFGDRVVPALGPGAAVGWPAVADRGTCVLGLLTGAVARLSFGAAERVLAWRLAAFGHGLTSVT